MLGVVTGSALVSGLAMYFAPDAADEVTARGNAIRDGVADAVEHGAHAVSHSAKEVERFARASKTDQHH